MRKILKALSLVMVLVMCFTMVFTTAVSAEGATPMLTINSAAVKEGETVTITVDAANFGAVAGAHFVVALPAELENVAVAESDYVVYNAEAGTVTFVKEANWTDGKCDGIADGALVTITATAAVGTYVVDFAETGKTVDFCDANYATIDVTKVAGEVVVETAVVETPVVESIQLGRKLLAEKTLGIRLTAVKSQLSSYDSYYVELKTHHYGTVDGVYHSLVESTNLYTYVAEGETVPEGYEAQVAEDGKYDYYDYFGITATEMTLPMSITIYCLNDDAVVAKSQTWTFTFADRIKTTLSGNNTDAVKALYMDMANYGEAAQTYFANLYPNSDLAANKVYANAGLEAYKDFATSDDIACAELASKEGFGGSKAFDEVTAAVGKGLVIAENCQPRFAVSASTYDVSKLKLKVNYVDSINGDKSVTINLSDIPEEDIDAAKNYYYYVYKDVSLYDTSVTVSAELYLEDTLLYTRTYSVEAFIAEKVSDSAINTFGDSLLKFSYSCRKVLLPNE